jgi:hypothetical protein
MENNIKELIQCFLETYCTLAKDDEDDAYIYLMMDNHKFVEIEGKGYYIPEDHILWSMDDLLLQEMIIAQYES